jgi:hypothetical protein
VTRTVDGKRKTQRAVCRDHLEYAIAQASGDGAYRFNERQLFYVLRPLVQNELGLELHNHNLREVITAYENERGDIPGMYREPRGSLYHPHTGDEISLGTLAIEDYDRPYWTFNKLLYVEKEGFSEALKADRWPERHDCAIESSKGYTTRAAKDLVDKLAEDDEPVEVFCVHDADAYGTMIYQTFQEATKARGARKIEIINLGLEPWEAIDMGLEVEEVEQRKNRKAVANYVLERDDLAPTGETWEEWLQTHRVELNAMTTPQFIAWLDGKMAEHGIGKLIPPDHILSRFLDWRLRDEVREAVTERILREANLERQVEEALAAIRRPKPNTLRAGVEKLFSRQPDAEWKAHILDVVRRIVRKLRGAWDRPSHPNRSSIRTRRNEEGHGWLDRGPRTYRLITRSDSVSDT